MDVPQIEYEDQVIEIPQIKHVHVPWHFKGTLVLGPFYQGLWSG